MIDHAPVLVIVAPLLGAVVSMLAGLRSTRTAWWIAAASAATQLGLALAVAWQVATGGAVHYVAGGFVAPYGIELVVDGLSAPLLVLVPAVFGAVLLYTSESGPDSTAFFTLLGLLVGGLTGLVVTADAFNLYVFLEISGLAAYALVASGRKADAAVAGFKYLLVGTVGASLYLLGVGFLLIATGTLNMADLAARIAAVGYTSPLIVAGFGLAVGGLVVKVALFPVHTWQPDAYANAPVSVATFISALVSTVAAYALARIVLSVFGADFLAAVPLARDVVVVVAAVSIVAGSVLAVLQSDVRRMLAYSSVSQFGIVVVAFALATPLAVVGGLIHLLGHAVMKGGLFATSGLITARTGARTIDDFAGLGGRDPVGAGAFAVLGLAMVGVPPAVGFVGKWYVVVGAANAGAWLVVAVVLASTLLTLGYFGVLVERMFFAEATPMDSNGATNGSGRRNPQPASRGMIVVVVAAALAAVLMGLVAAGLEPAVRATLAGVLAGG
jgi:multicomponent Na+:H+ antiporter subunit D